LYPDLSARENLAFFGRLQGLSGGHLDERVGQCLEVVGLVDRADDRIDAYSGGMKRRANIAAGLLHEPELLILDEPTVGVDPQSRNAILAAVDELGGAGLSVLYTTHYMEEAERLCDRVGIIDQGRLIAEGTRAELIALAGEQSRIRLRTGATGEGMVTRAQSLPGVVEVTVTPDGLDVLVDDADTALPPLVAEVDDVLGVEVDDADLEAVFLHLTGKALRD
jgi:ABC-2 type transport system ATP-binding protein